MTRQEACCAWCKGTTPPLTPVGCIERGTSAAALIYACDGCKTAQRLVPFSEHPDDTDGQPRPYPTHRGARTTP